MVSFGSIIKNNRIQSIYVSLLVILVVGTGLPFPLLLKLVVDSVLYKNNSNLGHICILFIFLVLCQLILNFILSFQSSKWSQSIAYQVRNKIYNLRIHSDINEFTKENDMTQTTIISDCEIVSSTFQNIFITIISSTLCFIAYSIILFYLNVYLFLLTIIFIPIFLILNLKLSNISKKFFFKIQQLKDSFLAIIMETSSGFMFIRIYQLQRQYFSRFRNVNKEMTNTSVRFNTIVTFINSMVSFLEVVAPFSILLLGGVLISEGKSTLGNIIACYSYSAALFSPVSQLIGLMPLYKELELSSSRINKLVKAPKKSLSSYTLSKDKKRSLAVTNLTVSYETGKIVIHNMTKSFYKGHVYLLQGPNASGKSTFAKVTVGLIKPIRGKISIAVNERICYIPQDAYLFKGSILFNLTVGIENYEKENLEKLLKVTLLDKDLSNGVFNLNSYVDNDNNTLSTGQIQKIKLIHALLSNPTILIIDEILTNMDIISQRSILNYLNHWKKDKTLLLISHSDKEINNILPIQNVVFPFDNLKGRED